ncbi:hypothetical protein PZB74_21110 [Porifericola rhodea]|uniref:hypothetical protein n=1 Tax=Porifericola rhodea TaxID=930972 RepID=UPI002665A00D|nr:hypothetical protein [Porifericola rhodea]WKN31452.1 hypothetical protein PZB74_21110 [Porifericola rhodea]
MKAVLLCLILIVSLISCSSEETLSMLNKQWKIVDSQGLVEGSLWLVSEPNDILDFRLLNSKSNSDSSGIYLEKNSGKSIIRFSESRSYFEVIEYDDEELKLQLYSQDSSEDRVVPIAIINCRALDRL